MAPLPLMEEIVEEVLLRIPPSDPASLVRAALVCKEWCRIVAGPGFRRRFRELHRTPPILGVICHSASRVVRFVPTSSCPPQPDHCDYIALDARHGRVLFLDYPIAEYHSLVICLHVWDPVTGERWELPKLLVSNPYTWNAAVLCAAHGACDHLDCHGGPFLVVVVDSDKDKGHMHIYSSESGSWSEVSSAVLSWTSFKLVPAALVGSALYFLTRKSKIIVKYELNTRNMSVIQPPVDFSLDCPVLTMVEDGGLLVAGLKDSRLYLWSMETGPKGCAGWAQVRVVQLQNMLPDNVALSYDYVTFAHGGDGIFFVGTNEGPFSIDLKYRQTKKVRNEACGPWRIHRFIPYMSFYTPALRMPSIKDGPPNEGASSA